MNNPLTGLYTCSKCNTIMDYKGCGKYKCPTCDTIEFNDYGKVREYVYDRDAGRTDMPDISKATGVDVGKILTMVRENKFYLAKEHGMSVTCLGCGAPIQIGCYCRKCLNNQNKGDKTYLTRARR